MTPWKGVASVDNKELLGPLVLDDLHKSGHYRFPAVEKSSQDIVGVLNIRSLVDVSVSNHTQRVDHAMSREVPTVLKTNCCRWRSMLCTRRTCK